MTETLWSRRTVGHPLPGVVAHLVDLVASGNGGALFPPVAAAAEDHFRHTGYLEGPDGAATVGAALADPAFAPLVAEIRQGEAWCARASTQWPDLFAPGILSVYNGDLFGPLLRELFTACAARKSAESTRYCQLRGAQWREALAEFVHRLSTDTDRIGELPGCRGPVTRLVAQDGETHHYGRRVLQVAFAGGGTLAYKPRPVTGEELFLSRCGGVFATLNELAGTDLPTLWCWSAGEYGWLEWIDTAEVPADPAAASTYWRRAGAVVAAAFAFGIEDLIQGNLLTGTGAVDQTVRPYPVDVEVFARPMPRLWRTGLVPDATGRADHAGLPLLPGQYTVDGPVACFVESGRRLVVTDRPWRTPDRPQSGGYVPWVPELLRGAFATWAAICRHRDALAQRLDPALRKLPIRVLRRDTSEYWDAWRSWLLTGSAPSTDFTPSERAALLRGDVPHFTGPTDVSAAALAERWTMTELGVAIRDLVLPALVQAGTIEHRDGVRVTLNEVAIDWPETGRRLIYYWDSEVVRLRPASLVAGEPAEAIGSRLRRIDDLDARIRTPWAMGRFADQTAQAQLEGLTEQAIGWLETVLDTHGWPGPALVGTEAAEAAARLVQHAAGPEHLLIRCLAAMTDAARRGDVPWRDVAAVIDYLLVLRGRPQQYGTKFEPVDGVLVPCRLADPAAVDRDRAAVGLPPLAEHTRQIRAQFGATLEEG